ncbi:MAG TPA: hypothetical protein VE445_01870 [Nitrososphaeraceae archaeon]|nr:hypothetical protein [Nitrososphaeraceae archaeon]
MVKQRKQTIEYRNVRLSIDTYKKLDKYLLELIQKRGDRHISLDEAIMSLIASYYSTKAKKKWIDSEK